ncbi:hypothetical protein ACHAPG_008323 [Botrytis cinerea]
MSHLWLVKEKNRSDYGLKWQEVIATNQAPNVVLGPHSYHYPPKKSVFAVQGPKDQPYIQDFENNICLPLQDFLVSRLSDCTWTLNVLRLGFEGNRYDNPIVIHLFVQTPDYFPDNADNAIKVLEGMEEVVFQNKKTLEEEVSLYTHFNSHVAFPDDNFRSEYKYRNGEDKLRVSIPALKDHVETKRRLKSTLDSIEFAIKNSAFKDAANIDKKYRNEILRKAALIRYNDAEDCCPNAGYVSAAPEEWRKVPDYVGNLDWAIIHNVCAAPITPSKISKEPQISNLIQSKQEECQWSNDECKAFDSKCQMLQDSEEFVIKHPSPSSVLCTNKVYFKAPSPTLDWLACEMNCFKSIHHREGHGISEECVFVGRQHGGRVSGGGDSGALIYDIDIDTTDADKHTAALIPMAMIWGGNHHGTTISGSRDVTYATPIGAVLKDIECEMGWDEGSLRFC